MSEYSIDLQWKSDGTALKPGSYSTNHRVDFRNGLKATMTSAPDFGGDPKYANPEQAMAVALSSCHMMTFLALAAKAKWPVASYYDRAVAHLGKNAKGQMSVTRVDLHPVVRFDTGFSVDAAELEKMQHRAHRYCFIANTLADNVEINILATPEKELGNASERTAAA